MKTLKNILIGFLLTLSLGLNAQVAINTDGSEADVSAILDLKSTDKVFLPPRMTEVQMNAISNPPEGSMVYCNDCNPKGPYYFDGSNWLNFASNDQSSINFSDVLNPNTGETWMDRNLGATQVATSSTDPDAYGDLYQWGRDSDGHEKRSSGITLNLSNSDTPGHGYFISTNSSPYDWRSPGNDNLWQGVNGTNNPCPSGYRLPTYAEWEDERQYWSSNNTAGAFGSPLKLSLGGYRDINGSVSNVGDGGGYWASSLDGPKSWYIYFNSGGAGMTSFGRAYGLSVRCIKD